jgi:hypothetical protein
MVIDSCQKRIQLIGVDDLVTHLLLEEIQSKDEHAQDPLSEPSGLTIIFLHAVPSQ